jgi:hypothetical protein
MIAWKCLIVFHLLLLSVHFSDALKLRNYSSLKLFSKREKGNIVKTASLQQKPTMVAHDDCKSDELSLIDLSICGSMATVLADIIVHPLDTIKIAQQTSTIVVFLLLQNAFCNHFILIAVPSNLFAACKGIVVTRGIAGLYHGLTPYLLGDSISGALKFSSFEGSLRLAESLLPRQFWSLSKFACAAFSMLVCSITYVPADVLKTKLQAGEVNKPNENKILFFFHF